MSETTDKKEKSGRRRLLIWIVIIGLLAVIALLVIMGGGPGGILSLFGGEVGRRDFVKEMHELVLRPEDLSVAYNKQHDTRLSNNEVIGMMTVETGKRYILDTGRLDGWDLYMEKSSLTDFGPVAYKSRVEIFETTDGARKAFSEDWHWLYTDPEKEPDEYLDKNCKYGSECLFFLYDDTVPGSGTSIVQYDVVFRYKNVLVWVYARGSDIDTTEDHALDAAQLIYDRLTAID